MIAELLLIGKLLEPLSKRSTPRAVSPRSLFGSWGTKKTERISKPRTKTKQVGPALGLKKYF